MLCRPVKSIQDILLTASETRNPIAVAKYSDRIIRCMCGCCHGDLMDLLRPADTVDHMKQHGLTGNFRHDLPRKS